MDTIGNFGIAQVEDEKMQTYDHHPQDGRVTPSDVTHIDARAGTGGGNLPLVASFMGGQGAKAGGIGYEENVFSTIKAAPSGGNQVPDIVCFHGSQDPISNTEHANAVNRNNGLENCVCQYGESAGTLTERHDSSPCSDRGQNVVAIPINSMVIGKDIKEGDRQTTCIGKEGDPCPTLQTEHHHAVASHLSVRRLLPIECERLMGFPDNWTKIPWRGKPADECPDAPRYKACGNSMGVNCMRWIGLGIEAVENGIRQKQQSKRSKK